MSFCSRHLPQEHPHIPPPCQHPCEGHLHCPQRAHVPRPAAAAGLPSPKGPHGRARSPGFALPAAPRRGLRPSRHGAAGAVHDGLNPGV